MTAMLLPERHAQAHWVTYARCADHPNPRLWFAELGHEEGYHQARTICRECPVRLPCLVQAIKQEGAGAHRAQRWGMWGGTTPAERQKVARQLRGVALEAWAPVLVGLLADLDAA